MDRGDRGRAGDGPGRHRVDGAVGRWSPSAWLAETAQLPRIAATSAPSPTTSGKSLATASGSMAVATVVSRVSALAARLLLAAALGFGLLNDSYNVANTLPNQIYELLLGGVLSSVAIPVLVRAQDSDDDGGVAYVQRLLSVGVVALALGTAAAVAAAPWLSEVSVGNGPGTDPALTTALAYLLLPQIFFYGLAALLGRC